jgi:thiopeptide-type bacteriocin biosynthesis protein
MGNFGRCTNQVIDGTAPPTRDDDGHTAADPREWIQYSMPLSAESKHRSALYSELHDVAQDLLTGGSIREFFYVHKSPGLRVRFQAQPSARQRVESIVTHKVATWKAAGLIGDPIPGIYEAETVLFGGERSMASVHRIFTADSLTWLKVLSAPEPPAARDCVWLVSLAMTRLLLDALEIVEFEDLSVWGRLRDQLGRRLGDAIRRQPEFTSARRALQESWSEMETLRDELSPRTRGIVEPYGTSVAETCRRWLDGYFRSTNATIGPRQAAAYLMMFHWNRGHVSMLRQALITEALASRHIDSAEEKP